VLRYYLQKSSPSSWNQGLNMQAALPPRSSAGVRLAESAFSRITADTLGVAGPPDRAVSLAQDCPVQRTLFGRLLESPQPGAGTGA